MKTVELYLEIMYIFAVKLMSSRNLLGFPYISSVCLILCILRLHKRVLHGDIALTAVIATQLTLLRVTAVSTVLAALPVRRESVSVRSSSLYSS